MRDWKHTLRGGVSVPPQNIQQELCISFCSAVCHSINCSYRAAPGSSPSVSKVRLHRQPPCPAQRGSAWHSGTWQCCWALKVSMPLHESGAKPSCKPGFYLCITGSPQRGLEVHLWICLSPPVAVNRVHLTFAHKCPELLFALVAGSKVKKKRKKYSCKHGVLLSCQLTLCLILDKKSGQQAGTEMKRLTLFGS